MPKKKMVATTSEQTEVEELARDVAKDVAETVSEPPKPKAKPKAPKPTRREPDRAEEPLTVDPDETYAKIAMVRVTCVDDQEMEEWLDSVKAALDDVTKNATVLTRHRMVHGKQVSNHAYEEALNDARNASNVD